MRRSLAPFSEPESLVHTRSLADFITTTSGFRFSVHTGLEPRSGPWLTAQSSTSIGTVTVAGDAVLGPGAVYQVENVRFGVIFSSGEDDSCLPPRASLRPSGDPESRTF
jgi:hypothetical protein